MLEENLKKIETFAIAALRKEMQLNADIEKAEQKSASELKKLFLDLVAIVDLLDLGLAQNEGNSSVYLRKVKKRVLRMLESHQIRPFSAAVGDPISPGMLVKGTENNMAQPLNTVLECVRTGYYHKDLILRYVEVIGNKQP